MPSSHKRPREPKNSPSVLVIEHPDPNQNIILALEDLEEVNNGLKNTIRQTTLQLEALRKLLGGI